jgi:hypothetical protein
LFDFLKFIHIVFVICTINFSANRGHGVEFLRTAEQREEEVRMEAERTLANMHGAEEELRILEVQLPGEQVNLNKRKSYFNK